MTRQDKARALLEQGCDLEERGQLELAFTAYMEAARYGNREAQVNLANLYDEGRGCLKSAERAVHWYKRSVSLGCCEAAENLAAHYRQNKNRRWERYWLSRAAAFGSADARAALALADSRAQPRTSSRR